MQRARETCGRHVRVESCRLMRICRLLKFWAHTFLAVWMLFFILHKILRKYVAIATKIVDVRLWNTMDSCPDMGCANANGGEEFFVCETVGTKFVVRKKFIRMWHRFHRYWKWSIINSCNNRINGPTNPYEFLFRKTFWFLHESFLSRKRNVFPMWN